MSESATILFPIFFPAAAGVLLLAAKEPERRSSLIRYTGAVLVITALAVLWLLGRKETSFTLFFLTGRLPVYFRLDGIGRLFAAIVTVIWVPAGFFGFEYMKTEPCNKRFFGFYLIVYGILMALDFSGNLITFYIFYELITLMSMPLVLHERTREAVMAGLKYIDRKSVV